MQTEQEARLPDISTSATPRPMHSVHVPLPLFHCMSRISCIAYTTGCLLPPSLSLSLGPPQAPLICLTPLSDHAQQGVRVSTY